MEKILITVKPEHNHVLDHYQKQLGGGSTKSGIIRDALDVFFKVKLGFKYQQIKNELDEKN